MRHARLAAVLLAPSLFGLSAFLLFPILVVIWLSLNRWDLLAPLRFVGLANYVDVFTDPTFGNSLYRIRRRDYQRMVPPYMDYWQKAA